MFHPGSRRTCWPDALPSHLLGCPFGVESGRLGMAHVHSPRRLLGTLRGRATLFCSFLAHFLRHPGQICSTLEHFSGYLLFDFRTDIFPERVEHNSHWPSNRVIKRPLPSMEDGESVYNSQCIRLDEENAAGPQRQTPAREFFFAPGSRRSGLLREENRSPRTKGLRLAVCLSRAVFSSPGFRDVAVMWAEPCPAHGDGREYCLLEPGRHLFASTWRHRAFIPCSLTDAYQAHSP